MRKKPIFISYSSEDKDFVSVLVGLLRGLLSNLIRPNPVFQDIDSIRPGQNWYLAIQEAIEGSERLFVFWCIHSKASKVVAREYNLALKLEKLVIPILLDSTPLPAKLRTIQWVDLRSINPHGVDTIRRRHDGGLDMSSLDEHARYLYNCFAPTGLWETYW